MSIRKPIILTTDEVLAVMDEIKTAHVIPMKKPPPNGATFIEMCDTMSITAVDRNGREYPKDVDGLYATFEYGGYPEFPVVKSPYGIGDVLYVRQEWARISKSVFAYESEATAVTVAKIRDAEDKRMMSDHWMSPVTMPREAARLFLRVTDVRPMRVQELTVEDVIAVGMPSNYAHHLFKGLWDKRYAKRGFKYTENPWVWMIEFEKTVLLE